MNKKFSFKDLPIIRQFLNLLDTGDEKEEEAPKTSKERALPTYKIYGYIEKQLALAGSISYDLGGYCNDVYVDQTGMFAIVTKNDGKMYKATVTVSESNDIQLGDWQEVVQDFKPVVGRTSTGIKVKRMASGQVRWEAWPACTAALNRDEEIDSRELFDSFIENIERTGEYPELDFFHLGPDLVLGRADHVHRDGYVYNASGFFYDTDIARRAAEAIEADPDFWGNSIQYYPSEAPEIMVLKDGSQIPVYKAGVNRFISLLPEKAAASKETSISTKGVNRMKDIQRKALKVLGYTDEEIEDLENKSRSVNENLKGEIKRGKTAAAATPKAKAKETPATSDLSPAERTKLRAQAQAILKQPEFAVILREELQALTPAAEGEEAEAAAAGEDDESEEAAEESEAEAVAEGASPTERAIMKQLKSISTELKNTNARLDGVDEIIERMDEAEENTEEELKDILADMPAKIGRTKIIRARSSRNSKETTPPTLKNQASNVLARIKEERVS